MYNLWLKSILSLCLTSAVVVCSASDFYVEPTRVVLNSITTSGQINIHNNSNESQIVQVSMKSLLQYSKGGLLLESTPPVMGDAQVVVTPVVITMPPRGVQPVRFLPIGQMDDIEIAYRVFLTSVTKRELTTNGTTIELGFGVPVYVLPKNIRENVSYSIARSGNNYTLKVSNRGNVHINVNKVILEDKSTHIAEIPTPGLILPGMTRLFTFSLDKKYQGYTSFNAEIKMQDLINFTSENSKTATINVN